ncbi:MAG: hypothetical protein EA361_19200 [Bacteroidetes bacterium]|nr:MAG: hypothetical protein EA361_19200 [Bacteroidota bacterium]
MEEVFTIDPTAYSTHSFTPQITAEIIQVGNIRSQRMAEVWIYPVQFNPVTGQLQVFTEIEVSLSFTNPTSEVSVNTGIFSNICQNVMLNYTEGGIGASINDRSSSTGTVSWIEVTDTSGEIEADYLIIAAPAFFNSQNADLQALADHRAEYNGFNVAIVNVADVISDAVGYPYNSDENWEVYKDEQRIRNFIQSVYESEMANNTYDGKLGYVLLVGDDNVSTDYLVRPWRQPPPYPTEIHPKDYNYSCLTHKYGVYDNYGDLFIGRFSVDSEAKLQNIVNKTIAFETEYQFAGWKNNVMLIAGLDDGSLQEEFNETTDNINSMIPANFNISKYKASELGGENTMNLTVNGLNQGQLLTHYYGHGDIQHWGGGIFPVSAFQEIENHEYQGVIVSSACWTGMLDSDSDCMAEYFTTSNKGSVIFIGATRAESQVKLTPFALGIFEAIWKNFSHIGGEFKLEAQILSLASFTGNNLMYFGDPALNIMAHGYQITEDVTLYGEYNISTDITLTNNATVTISNGTKIHFDTNGKFIIDEGASMVLGNNVTISRMSEESDVSIYGNMELTGKLTSAANFNILNGGSFFINSNAELKLTSDAGISIEGGGGIDVTGRLTSDSSIEILNGGNFVANSHARLKLTSDAGILVAQGGTFTLNNCATYEQASDGILKVNSNANLCIYPEAVLDVPGHSAFNISTGAIIPSQCVHPLDVVPPSYKITQNNQIWSEVEYRMDRNLEIHPGANLLLEDVNLRFQNNTNIVVRANGVLNIDGGILTNHSSPCSEKNHWQGIRVRGNSDLPQTYQNQGALIMSNGAIIRNASIAVGVGDLFFDGFTNNNYGGGIVQLNNAQFINNQRDIEFNSYQNTNSQGQPIDNISYFHHCQFTANDRLLFSTVLENVKLNGVQGISFNHASFSDSRTNITETSRRTGIRGYNATFMVYNSNFNQLHYGIYATSPNPNRFFRAFNSDFSTYRGIYFNMMDNVIIQNNSFFVIPFTQIRCSDSYGVYLDKSTGYQIENNVFESLIDADCNKQLGIINHNTGSYYNELYRNNFSGLTIGIEAIGSNRGFKPEEGLEIRCNQFENNHYDIFVTPLGLPAGRLEGIRELQGYDENSNHLTTSPAGNLFGNNSPVLISNFINDAERLFYFHHIAEVETRLIPNDYSQNIFLQETGHKFNYEYSCPDRAMQPKTFNVLITEKQDAQTHYEETSVLLQAYVDDGNTQLMTQQVEMAGEGDAYNTYQYLMQTSPYLSEEVLTSLGAKEEGFNNAMIRDVMVENPQAAKSQEVELALDSRIGQLPAYMRWQINNGLYQFSEKEIMEQYMAYQKTRHDLALNKIIRGIVHEQEGFENAPSLDQLLAQVDDVRYQYLRAELKFAEGDYAAGLQQLNQVAQQYNLSDENALLAHQEKTDFYTLLSQWSNHEDHPGFTNLPAEVLLQLENYLEATPRVAGKTLSLLILNNAIEYEEPILYPQEDMLPKTDPASGPDEFMMPDIESELRFGLYPNPSRDYLTLDWCIESPRLAQSGKIEFRNSTGVLVHTLATHIPCNQQILPLDGWKSGTYTATLTLNNQLRKSISFVVAK